MIIAIKLHQQNMNLLEYAFCLDLKISILSIVSKLFLLDFVLVQWHTKHFKKLKKVRSKIREAQGRKMKQRLNKRINK